MEKEYDFSEGKRVHGIFKNSTVNSLFNTLTHNTGLVEVSLAGLMRTSAISSVINNDLTNQQKRL